MMKLILSTERFSKRKVFLWCAGIIFLVAVFVTSFVLGLLSCYRGWWL